MDALCMMWLIILQVLLTCTANTYSSRFSPSVAVKNDRHLPEERNSTTNKNQCGTPSIAPSLVLRGLEDTSRIVGGTEATPHSWPWQVVLTHRRGDSSALYFHCGGSIISDRWIMTAAHCCTIHPLNMMQVIIGDHDMTTGSETYQTESSLDFLAVHPAYDVPTILNNDFCLLKTRQVISFNEHVQPICLPNVSDPPVGTECYTSGWGSTAKNVSEPDYSPVLKQVNMRITNRATCNRFYGIVTPSMICASIPGQGSCVGDSGGPLMCQNGQSDQWELVGVTSFVSSAGCGHIIYPTVYAKTSSVLDWISSTIQQY